MAYSTTPFANLKGPAGEPGPAGPAGPASADGLVTDAAIATNLANPETDSNAAAVSLIGATVAASPSIPTRYFIDADSSAARPAVVGPVDWYTTVDVEPAHIRNPAPVGTQPDTWNYIDPDTIPWTPLSDSGLQFFYDSTATGGVDNTALSTLVDHSSKGRNMSASTNTGIGGTPVFHSTLFGGHPAVTYPFASSLQSAYSITGISLPPQDYIVLGANVQFGSAGANNRTAWTLGGTGNGNFSFFKTPAGAYGTSIDNVTAYSGGADDAQPHSVLVLFTANHLTLWVDGTAVVDTAHTITRGTATSFRIGYVAASTNLATLRPLNGGSVSDMFAVYRTSTPNLAGMRAWLLSRRS